MSTPPNNGFGTAIRRRAARRRQRRDRRPLWFGLGALGVLGWTVVVPIVLGLAFGLWMDSCFMSGRSFTLMFLALGLLIGCVQAWQWVSEQHRAMFDDTHRKGDV